MNLERLFFCACLLAATPALADFHYTPSTSPAPLPQAAPGYSPPSAPIETAPLTPPASMTDTTASLNAPGMSAPTQIAPSAPSWKMNSATAPAPVSAPATPRMSGGGVVQGFGNQIPLVIALRQIVPDSYQFSYGTNVPLGSMVDWKGGRPWKDVLMDVLTPLGLTASENGTLIKIDRM